MKRVLSKLNSVVAVFLAFVLSLMIGYVALRNPVRMDLSKRHYYELSEKTLQLSCRDACFMITHQKHHPKPFL